MKEYIESLLDKYQEEFFMNTFGDCTDECSESYAYSFKYEWEEFKPMTSIAIEGLYNLNIRDLSIYTGILIANWSGVMVLDEDLNIEGLKIICAKILEDLDTYKEVK